MAAGQFIGTFSLLRSMSLDIRVESSNVAAKDSRDICGIAQPGMLLAGRKAEGHRVWDLGAHE